MLLNTIPYQIRQTSIIITLKCKSFINCLNNLIFKIITIISLCSISYGCANTSQMVNNTLGQISGVSLLIDQNDLNKLSDNDAIMKLSNDELKAIAERPVPQTPGISFEVAMMRKIMAYAVLGNTTEVHRARTLMVQISPQSALLPNAYSIGAFIEFGQGNNMAALRIANEIENKYYIAARDHQPGSAVDSESILGVVLLHVSTLIDSGQIQEAERLIKTYLEPSQAFSMVSPYSRHDAKIRKLYLQTQIKFLKYNNEKACNDYDSILQIHRNEKFLSEKLSEKESSSLRNLEALLLYKSMVCYRAFNQMAKANERLESLKKLSKQNPNQLSLKNIYLDAEGDYRLALGEYDAALKARRAARDAHQSWTARMNIAQDGHVLATAPLMYMLGDSAGALQLLLSRNALPRLQGSSMGDFFAQQLVFIGANIGHFDSSFNYLEQAEPRAAQLPMGEALLHYGAKTFGYERRAHFKGVADDYILAVHNGRNFAAHWRALRTQNKRDEMYLPPAVITSVKEAYLRSAMRALGKGGVSYDDVLDALAMLQTTDADQDISAAALRMKEIPGVNESEMRQLQDLYHQANEAKNIFNGFSRAIDADPKQLADLAAKANKTHNEYTRYLGQLQRKSPALTQALGMSTPTIADLQSRLSTQDALISFVPIGTEHTFALLITKNRVAHRMLVLGRDQSISMTKQIRDSVTFKTAVSENNSTRGLITLSVPLKSEYPGLEPFHTTAASNLFDQLLGWAEPTLKNVKSLAVITNGPLAGIPFGLLLERPVQGTDYKNMPWLIKSKSIVHMPSFVSWYAQQTLPMQSLGNTFIAWAHPDYFRDGSWENNTSNLTRGMINNESSSTSSPGSTTFPKFPYLPNTLDEAKKIAGILRTKPQNDIVIGSQATRQSVLDTSSSGVLMKKSVVLFATHGLAPGEIEDLFQPALLMAAEQNNDKPSLLELKDVMTLRMNADWVLLSACNTASADKKGGDPVSGLARGFIFAGARSILATHWHVDTESAANITTETLSKFNNNPRINRAQALQQTAIEMIEARKSKAEWSHPAHWAAYALVGDGRRK